MSQIPDDPSIEDVPPGGYGETRPEDTINLDSSGSEPGRFAIHTNIIYTARDSGQGERISIYNLDGSLINNTIFDQNARIFDIGILNNQIYVLHTTGSPSSLVISVYNLPLQTDSVAVQTIELESPVSSLTTGSVQEVCLGVTPTRFLISRARRAFHDGDDDHIYLLDHQWR